MRIVFMGTPDFAVPTLGEIVGAGQEVAAVYTQPPRPAGRGMDPRPSAVHSFAETHGLQVLTPSSMKDAAAREAFAGLEADVAVVVAYGQILPAPVLDAPRLGCLNLHASLLPRWRGGATNPRAILAGDEANEVCVLCMEEELDTRTVCL
ncbi:MAG: methionyl-tRNA formyltransferase, partial [Hyphomicrobiales bacterium]